MNAEQQQQTCPYLMRGQECGEPLDGGKSGLQRVYVLYCAEHARVILRRIGRLEEPRDDR